MMSMKKIWQTIAVASLAFSVGTTPTLAAVLEEVVVTAQKREESLQDVGIAITAFTGDQMKQLGYTNAQQITAMSPGVTTIQPNGPSAFFVSIRGVGQNDFSGDHQESPVSIYLDEAYISAAAGAGFQLFDMQRAEVLRGPQGTLFGRNATGGLVHYITKKPTEEFEGYADFTYGSYNQIKVEGAVSGPTISDTVLGRFSFVKNEHDPYVENRIGTDLNDGDDWAVRGQLLFDFSNNAEWLVSARVARQDIDTGFFEHSSSRLNPVTGLGEDFNGPDLTDQGDSPVGPYQDTDNDVHAGDYNVIGFNKLETEGITSNLKLQFGELDFVSITDWASLKKDYIEDSDAGPNDFFAFFLQSDMSQFSQEFRLSGETDRLRWLTGLYYLNITGDFANGGAIGNFAAAAFPNFGFGTPATETVAFINPFSTNTESYAIFGQLDFDLTDELTATAGARYSIEKKDIDYAHFFGAFETTDRANVATTDALELGGALLTFNPRSVTTAPGGTGFTGLTFTGPGDLAVIDEGLITAKLQLDWRPNDDTLIYASFNRGVKAGGFNAPLDGTNFYDGTLPLSALKFDKEVLHAYETGFKWTFADGLARLNGAAYYYDYRDYQAFALDSLTTFVFNTDAEVKGMELELQTTPMEGLDVLLGASYIDNTVEDGFTRPDGSTVDRVAVLTPEFSLNGLARYEWPLLGGSMSVQYDFSYIDDHFFQLKNSPVGKEDGYVISNARISYLSGDEHWSAAFFVNNLTDEEYRTMVFDLAGTPAQGGFGITENYYAPPRWFGATVGYNW